jgi:hypothetical protein
LKKNFGQFLSKRDPYQKKTKIFLLTRYDNS